MSSPSVVKPRTTALSAGLHPRIVLTNHLGTLRSSAKFEVACRKKWQKTSGKLHGKRMKLMKCSCNAWKKLRWWMKHSLFSQIPPSVAQYSYELGAMELFTTQLAYWIQVIRLLLSVNKSQKSSKPGPNLATELEPYQKRDLISTAASSLTETSSSATPRHDAPQIGKNRASQRKSTEEYGQADIMQISCRYHGQSLFSLKSSNQVLLYFFDIQNVLHASVQFA